MRHALPLLAVSFLGCSSLLGLDDFQDAPASGGTAGMGAAPSGGQAGTGAAPSGGAGGTSGGGGSTSGGGGGATGGSGGQPSGGGGGAGGTVGGAGGAGGSGGASGGADGGGGAPPVFKCDPEAGGPTALLTGADFGGETVDPENLVAVHSQGMAHVGIVTKGTGDYHFHVRTIRDVSLSWVGSYGAFPHAARPRLVDGLSLQSTAVTFWGVLGDSLFSRLTFQIQPGSGVLPAGNHVPTAVPTECQGGQVEAFAYHPESSWGQSPVFACNKSGVVSLWMSFGSPPVATKVTETSNPADYQKLMPRHYTVTNGTHLVFLKDGYYRYGTNPAELAMVHQLDPTGDPSRVRLAYYASPLAGVNPVTSAVLGIGSFKSDASLGDVWAGTTAIVDYLKLASSPPPTGMPHVWSSNSSKEATAFERRSVDADSVVAAGLDQAKSRIRVLHASRTTGKMNVFNQEVYAAPTNHKVLRAVAVQVSQYDVVAWAEEDATGKVTVWAQRFVCGT
ncbi:MAG: hypothetical protein HYZ29_13210 [Myxococcales bacterium]|nr:hypothetical protein [Myxococcales bacterium]